VLSEKRFVAIRLVSHLFSLVLRRVRWSTPLTPILHHCYATD
jgi:hypothetical protein